MLLDDDIGISFKLFYNEKKTRIPLLPATMSYIDVFSYFWISKWIPVLQLCYDATHQTIHLVFSDIQGGPFHQQDEVVT